eukprot:GSA25T00010526001.1
MAASGGAFGTTGEVNAEHDGRDGLSESKALSIPRLLLSGLVPPCPTNAAPSPKESTTPHSTSDVATYAAKIMRRNSDRRLKKGTNKGRTSKDPFTSSTSGVLNYESSSAEKTETSQTSQQIAFAENFISSYKRSLSYSLSNVPAGPSSEATSKSSSSSSSTNRGLGEATSKSSSSSSSTIHEDELEKQKVADVPAPTGDPQHALGQEEGAFGLAFSEFDMRRARSADARVQREKRKSSKERPAASPGDRSCELEQESARSPNAVSAAKR